MKSVGSRSPSASCTVVQSTGGASRGGGPISRRIPSRSSSGTIFPRRRAVPNARGIGFRSIGFVSGIPRLAIDICRRHKAKPNPCVDRTSRPCSGRGSSPLDRPSAAGIVVRVSRLSLASKAYPRVTQRGVEHVDARRRGGTVADLDEPAGSVIAVGPVVRDRVAGIVRICVGGGSGERRTVRSPLPDHPAAQSLSCVQASHARHAALPDRRRGRTSRCPHPSWRRPPATRPVRVDRRAPAARPDPLSAGGRPCRSGPRTADEKVVCGHRRPEPRRLRDKPDGYAGGGPPGATPSGSADASWQLSRAARTHVQHLPDRAALSYAILLRQERR